MASYARMMRRISKNFGVFICPSVRFCPDTHRDFGAVAEACAERYDKRDVSRADETCRGNREMQGNTGNYFRYTEPQAFFVRESCTYHPKSSGGSGGGHLF